MARFPIAFDSVYRVLSSALFISPSDSYVEVLDDEIRVRMAWSFRARFPRSAVKAVTPYDRQPLSRGVHGWAGTWLVNGAGDRIVDVELDPKQRGWVTGFPVRVRHLLVSVEDPSGLMDALKPR